MASTSLGPLTLRHPFCLSPRPPPGNICIAHTTLREGGRNVQIDMVTSLGGVFIAMTAPVLLTISGWFGTIPTIQQHCTFGDWCGHCAHAPPHHVPKLSPCRVAGHPMVESSRSRSAPPDTADDTAMVVARQAPYGQGCSQCRDFACIPAGKERVGAHGRRAAAEIARFPK